MCEENEKNKENVKSEGVPLKCEIDVKFQSLVYSPTVKRKVDFCLTTVCRERESHDRDRGESQSLETVSAITIWQVCE